MRAVCVPLLQQGEHQVTHWSSQLINCGLLQSINSPINGSEEIEDAHLLQQMFFTFPPTFPDNDTIFEAHSNPTELKLHWLALRSLLHS